jgi:hypothetical protein
MPMTGPEIRAAIGRCFDEANAKALRNPKMAKLLAPVRAPLSFRRNKQAAEPEDRILVDREGVAYLTERPVKLKGKSR